MSNIHSWNSLGTKDPKTFLQRLTCRSLQAKLHEWPSKEGHCLLHGALATSSNCNFSLEDILMTSCTAGWFGDHAAKEQDSESVHLLVPLSAVCKMHMAVSNLRLTVSAHVRTVKLTLRKLQQRNLRCSCICHMPWKLHEDTATKKAPITMSAYLSSRTIQNNQRMFVHICKPMFKCTYSPCVDIQYNIHLHVACVCTCAFVSKVASTASTHGHIASLYLRKPPILYPRGWRTAKSLNNEKLQ